MIVAYLLFIGSGLYLASALLFLYIFIRTLRTTDGIGLAFLKLLSFSLLIGSFVIFYVRIATEYGNMDMMTGRAIAVFNPALLVGVGLYLNYLFHQKDKGLTKTDSEKISEIRENVKEVKSDVKEVKNEIVK